jgi:hypothetical protein
MSKLLKIAAISVLLTSLLVLPVFAEGTTEAASGEWWAFWKMIDVDGLRAWFEVEVMPHLASVSVILGVALAELIPAVRGLLKAKAAFTKVAGDVDAYNQAKIEYDMRVEKREKEFEDRIERLQEEHNKQVETLNRMVETYEKKLSESEERLASTLRQIESHAEKVERMVYVGMTNSCELVSNGAARRIAAIEADEDEEPEDVETEEYSDGE